jgi:hypothetical protein
LTKLPRPVVVLCAALTAACDIGEHPPSYVIAGPSVLSTGPTQTPYVWDTREELANWIENPVARGPLLLDGTGLDAVIEINRADQAWVARGPDFSPAVTGVRTLRLRYRWRPDNSLPDIATQTAYLTAVFQTTRPIHSFDPTAQAAAQATLTATADWKDIEFRPNQYTPPIDVEYCYVHSLGANRGVLEIDRLELIR